MVQSPELETLLESPASFEGVTLSEQDIAFIRGFLTCAMALELEQLDRPSNDEFT